MDPDEMARMDREADARLRAKLGTRGSQRNDGGWCGCSPQSGGCGEAFNSLSGFDKHRKSGTCLSPSEMEAQGWTRNRYGRWIVEARGVLGASEIRGAA